MFLVDDVIFFPVRGLVWIFREIHHAAEKDKAAEPAAITARLGELYMMLETGKMTEAEFDAAEKTLLDRLDTLQAESAGDEDEDEDEEEEDEEEEEEDEDEEDEGESDRIDPEGLSKGRAEP